MQLSPQIEALIAAASARTGVPADTLRSFVRIESGGRPDVVTGSYRGLLQLSPQEFSRYGGQGDIMNPEANMMAGATKIKAESDRFASRYGRAPSADELYMLHQQGEGGAAAHMSNPDAPAWRNMAGTAEGREKGEGWARQAIWGNVPADVRQRYGSVENITSRQFMDLWKEKVGRFGGGANDGAVTTTAAVAPIHQSGYGRETMGGGNAFAANAPAPAKPAAEAPAPEQPANAFASVKPYEVQSISIAAPDDLPQYIRRRSYAYA